MKVVVVGTGYVGLVQGACLAHLGHQVVCVDVLPGRIDALNAGTVPMYEQDLPELVAEGRASGRLLFTTDLTAALIQKPAVVFVCVQTPQTENGACDLSYVKTVLCAVGPSITPSTLVVVKSTVPPNTLRTMHDWLGDSNIQIASNPEFLSQGTSVRDFLHPSRIVFGVESNVAETVLRNLHKGIDAPVVVTTVEGAQLAKYAANAMLATRLSFMNEIAKLADVLGADIKAIEEIVGLDPRIGPKFLRSSAGFGGGCLPKDTEALHKTAQELGTDPQMFCAVLHTNEQQPAWFVKKIASVLGDVSGMRLAVWGLSFNQGTDDVRHSPAMHMIRLLKEAGAELVVFDPVAMKQAWNVLGESVVYAPSMLDALPGSHALLVLTEWPEFQNAAWETVATLLENNAVFDGKHFLSKQALHEAGLELYGIGL